MMARHFAFLLIIAASMTACAISQPQAPDTPSYQVLSRGHDKGGEFCQDFSLTPAQAATFFSLATERTPRQIHDDFDYLPCWVRGKGSSARGSFEWEVRAGGTASMRWPDGSYQMLGCDKCETLLLGKSAPPRTMQ
jgi:hypothetical protein